MASYKWEADFSEKRSRGDHRCPLGNHQEITASANGTSAYNTFYALEEVEYPSSGQCKLFSEVLNWTKAIIFLSLV
jgi:hypothetical protein